MFDSWSSLPVRLLNSFLGKLVSVCHKIQVDRARLSVFFEELHRFALLISKMEICLNFKQGSKVGATEFKLQS